MDRPLVIVGDSMLDVDIEGSATRLSPEAPVPVVDTERVWQRPGGAGLAAVLAARAEQDVVLVTAVGDDADGGALTDLLAHAGVTVLPEKIEVGLNRPEFRGGSVSWIRPR